MEDFPGAVGESVVNDDDLVRHSAEVEFKMEVLDRRGDAPFLVPGGNHHREEVHEEKVEGGKRKVERLLQRKGFSLSTEEIKYAISQVHTVVIEDSSTGQKMEMQSALTTDAEKIFSTLGISTERTTSMKTSCCA